MRKKILVTGGSGYKGVKLIKRLVDEGYDVINLDLNYFGNYFINSSHIKNYKLDILQIQKLNLKNVYACIHLACIANDPMVDLNPSLINASRVFSSKECEGAMKTGCQQLLLSKICIPFFINLY